MSAERSTESIIDLLYGELSEDEARQVREDLAESAELRGDLAEFESMLDGVRDAMPVEEVSPSIHASIMEAARVGAQNADNDRMIRRAAPEQGFWSRVGRGQGSQIALVAAVLIAGLFVVKAVERGSSPLHAPAGDISAMREAAPAMAAPEPTVAADEESEEQAFGQANEGAAGAAADESQLAKGGEAIADQWTPEPEIPAEAEPPADVASSLRAELDGTRNLEEDKDAKQQQARTRAPKAPSKSAAPARKKSRPKKKPSTVEPTPKPAPKQEAKADLFTLGDSTRDDASGRSGNKSSSSSSSDSLSGGLVQGKSGLDAPAAEPMPAAAEEKEREYRAPANSLSAVSERYRASDYGGTIRAADEFLTKNKSAPDTDRASAMFFKAQSLEKQGKYTQADRIYVAIQKNYPTFESAQIDRARKEIQQKNVRKPAPKSKRKSLDLDVMAPESSSSYE